ncbi:MAG: DUF2877 domain-containing protein [Anaerolineales bacterium]|nr:DUF2877 domain-containing protein [Anaerolineales bacterium]
MTSENTLQATLAAPRAIAWLMHTSKAEILQCFPHVCNLVNQKGDVVSLVTTDLGPDPIAFVISWNSEVGPFVLYSRKNPKEFKVSVTERRILLDGLIVNVGEAVYWEPSPEWHRVRGRWDHLRRCSCVMHRHLQDSGIESLGPLIDAIRLGAIPPAETQSPRNLHDRILQRALEPAIDLCRGIVNGDPAECRRGIQNLAGLGGGLTPAGDDFILGAMAALWTIHSPEQARLLSGEISDEAEGRIHVLSQAWLRSMASGEIGIAWHKLIRAMAGDDDGELKIACEGILAVGSSSGADALSGFIATLNLLDA